MVDAPSACHASPLLGDGCAASPLDCRHRADLVCVSPTGMTVAVDLSVCHDAAHGPLDAVLCCRDALKCREYGAAGNGAILPSWESFLPFSVLGSLGHLSAGALTFLHLLMHDLTLKRVHGGSSQKH
eukprot:5784850-Amphidinium_carterae.1